MDKKDHRDPGGRAFPFLKVNRREEKPRKRGITEIRGPYYTPLGKRGLEDILETMGAYVDILKFGGGSFSLMPRRVVREILDLCHAHQVMISTGGFIERVLVEGSRAVDLYFGECHDLGFDIVEISSGFLSLPADDFVALVRKVQEAGMKAKAEVGIQFGAGGATSVAELEAEGTRDVRPALNLARRCLDAGAHLITIESEGITECVRSWRTDVVAQVAEELGLEKTMFEAADPEVFAWYVKNYGPEVNLFIDHSQIVHLESVRSGNWGTKAMWGRVLTYGP